MKYLLSALTLLLWAFWLGGLMTLFVIVQVLFKQDRTTAIQTAPLLFEIFERYQLALAAAAVIAAGSWSLLTRLRLATVIFILIGFSTIGAAVGPLFITRKMQDLRKQQLTATPEFRKLHGQSMMVYLGQTSSLALAGLLLPVALRRSATSPPPPHTTPEAPRD